MHTFIHACIPAYMQPSYMHAYMQTFIHTCRHAYMLTCIRDVLKVRVLWFYLNDHFRWFKRLAKVSRKNTLKDYICSRKMRDSSVVQ